MTRGLEQFGVVVVMDTVVVSGLAKLAERHHWPLIHLPEARQAMTTLGRQRVDIAVVHIAVDVQQTVQFVEWLRATRREVMLIAVAGTHHEEAERLVRHAGANCYLPHADEVTLERAIGEILQQAQRLEPSRMTNSHDPARLAGSSGSMATRQGA